MAITAAPATAATPMLAMLTDAAPVEELPAAEDVPDVEVGLDDVGELEGVDAGFVDVEGRLALVVAGVEVPAADVVGEDDVGAVVEAAPELLLPPVAAEVEEPPLEAELVKQLLDPALMVKGADEAVLPVLSRIVRPMEVPAAILVFQVSEVLLC